jgi:orotidine-5'-phosphate decarboxylase
MNDADWQKLGMTMPIQEQVVRLAKLTKEAGLDGVVASPLEAADIRKACGADFMIVTPGVRPQGASVNDQSRIATPSGALKNGASHLVIGRPITAAENPREAAEKIIAEMEGVK